MRGWCERVVVGGGEGVVWRSRGFLPWTMAVAKDRRGRWG